MLTRNRTARRTRNLLAFSAAAAVLSMGGRTFGAHFKDADPAAGNGAADPFEAMGLEFSRLQGEALGIVNAAAAANRELTADETAANETRFARMGTITKLSGDRAKFAALKFAAGDVQLPRMPAGADADRHVAAAAGTLDRAEFSRALSAWGNTGAMAGKFATITTASQSGVFLPKTVGLPTVPTALNTLREMLAIYGQQPISTDSASDLSMPVMDASAGGVVAQDAGSETENAPVLTGSYNLNVATYQSGSAWFSAQQLLAVGFDLLAYAQQDLEYAKELALEAAAVAAIIADAGVTQTVATSSVSAFTYANLVSLNNKLPKRYAGMRVILLSQAAYTAAEALVGDDGHPVLNVDPQNVRLMRFNGTPVLRCDYLEAFGANKIVGLVISLIGFKLRDVTERRLERYTMMPGRPAQTGLNLIGFHGFGYTASAVAKFKCPAS